MNIKTPQNRRFVNMFELLKTKSVLNLKHFFFLDILVFGAESA